MVLHKKPDNVRLGMVIEIKAEKFIYRTFFVRGSKMKTYHEGAKDAEFEYNEVWRLAPRKELYRKQDPSNARIGQTLRFFYEQSGYVTVVVYQTLSKSIKCRTECGRGRGNMQVFDINEIDDCMELFCSSLLQKLLTQVKNSS